jgi:hypothetical protein
MRMAMDCLQHVRRFRRGLYETLGLALTVTACGPTVGNSDVGGTDGETTGATSDDDGQTSSSGSSAATSRGDAGSTSGGTGRGAETGSGDDAGSETTGGGLMCPEEPPPEFIEEYICFDRPAELASCEDCDDACVQQGSWSSLCDEFCCPEHVTVMCGPDPAPQMVDQCCYFVAHSAANICEGRPFVVDGVARVAPLRPTDQWLGSATPSVGGLDDATRAALGTAWRDDAQMEHASVASFARFMLQLLSVGAPPQLLIEAQRAIADEIEHARLCFSLAAAYDEGDLGPAPFDIDDALGEPGLAAMAAATVVEGCINETTAAVLADAAAQGAKDPVVRASLRRIADDETRHAALAWRTVQWALDVGGDLVARAVQRAFAEALAAPLPVPQTVADVDDEAMRAHGRLPAHEQLEVARAVRTQIVAPCAEALLTSTDKMYGPELTTPDLAHA